MTAPRRRPLLPGVLPVRRAQVPAELLAGVTLAALSIPEVLGYARIAGMPVVTGLYTLLIPMALFALLGSSRHLVVGADSATAAILRAAVAPLAVVGSAAYVGLAGLAALLAGALLLVARVARLGFLADFLSRTVLVGFLTGVGVQVAIAQLPDLLGVTAPAGSTPGQLLAVVQALPRTQLVTLLVGAAVLTAALAMRRLSSKVPGALIAVVGAVLVSRLADLSHHGVAVLCTVPSGLPQLQLPTLDWHAGTTLVGAATSMFVVILAQSAATSRAYAMRYQEPLDTDTDLLALAAANVGAAVSGTFVVNGSPTKTQMVDDAGGRSQLAMLSTAGVVLVVLLFLTEPLAYLPDAALAAVVLLIAVELIDVRGLRRILAARPHEFTVAVLTAVAVVVLGVEQGIFVAAVASIVEHLRHSYRPLNSVLAKSQTGHWRPGPVIAGGRTEPGLVVYRFGTSLYYANAGRLAEDLVELTDSPEPLRWFVLDAAAIGDIDYTAAATLRQVVAELTARGVRVVFASVLEPVQAQLDRFGITGSAGVGPCYDTAGEALEAYHEQRS